MTNNCEPMGMYIHIPFCLRRCAYCDFYSLPINDPAVLENYTRSVIAELQLRQAEIKGLVTTIYLGGGTPSLLSPVQIERILNSIFTHYGCDNDPEISMEVNPATVDRRALLDLRAAGVNRLSIGVQSFAESELHLLGRVHSGADAADILTDAGRAGFTNFNVDLIYGVPGQTMGGWQENLKKAADFNPSHISAYLLQLEPGTLLAKRIAGGRLGMLTEDLEAELYDWTRYYLKDQGYCQYEISNFARPGRECRHNLHYWRSRKYLGLGAGAVSFDGKQRIINQPPVEEYVSALQSSRLPVRQVLETMDDRQRIADAIIMGLRMTQGIDLQDFRLRFGIDLPTAYQAIIQSCQEQGLLELDHERIYLSPRAYFLSNLVLSQFVD